MKGTYISKIVETTISNPKQFRWCTKEEIKYLVAPEYFSAIGHMLFF